MPKHTRHGCGFAGGKFNTRLHYLAGFAAYQENPLIVVLVTVTETFFLHFAFAVGQYLVKEQEMAVAEAAVVPKWIVQIITQRILAASLPGWAFVGAFVVTSEPSSATMGYQHHH